MELKAEIKKLLNENANKTNGVHVSNITNYIVNEHNDLFSLIEIKDRDKLQARINGLLLYDVKKKSGNEFSKVKNTKTGKDKKGYYKIRNSQPAKVKPKKDNLLPHHE